MINEQDGVRWERNARMDNEIFRARLEQLIRDNGMGFAAVSRLLGRNPAYIQQYIKRAVPKRLGETERRTLAQHFGVSEQFLGAPTPPSRQIDAQSADCILIPYLNVENASRPVSGQDDALAFDRKLARNIAGGRATYLAALTIEGDSMFPTLSIGDKVLVHTEDRTTLRDGIYVLKSNGALLVKRISIHPVTRRVSILSDNSAYPSFADCDPDEIMVIGRVYWVGRQLA